MIDLLPAWAKTGECRQLTAGEVRIAALLFRDSIDYGRVRIHARRYIPFQPMNCAMTPNGHLYFHSSCFADDYSLGSPVSQHWFLHEMVHVWQFQLGYAVRLRGMIRIGLGYDYDLSSGKTLADFNMEAQGDLLADYFALRYMFSPATMRQQQYATSLSLYEQTISGFLSNPASVSNLPRGIGRLFLGMRWGENPRS